MKLSLSWIFDHIDANPKQQDVNLILSKFNTITAEIENFKQIKFDLADFYLSKVLPAKDCSVFNVTIPELKINISLSAHALSRTKGQQVFMIKKEGDSFRWASLRDFGLDKDGLMPQLYATKADLEGLWRNNFENEDTIIEIDNKSITHRPDMWSHRGFAREIAAILDLPFKDSKKFLAKHEVSFFENNTQQSQACPILIENLAESACSRFCGLYFKSIENTPSNLFITSRLLNVGSRPINGIVDLTNYLMQDWGQPVHAYDASKIEGKKVVIRMAREGEKLMLLDENEVTLTNQDVVIADSVKPMCLAGVKGGAASGVDESTSSIFLEAATFDAATIRKSAFRHKIRTDSSARFEKTLDPNFATEATLRFLHLAKKYKIKAAPADCVLVVGCPIKESVIEVEHEFFIKRIGVDISTAEVVNPLKKIGFKVVVKKSRNKSVLYQVTVPTYRSSKDIKIKEDILEEVARFYGFYRIPLTIPQTCKTPFDFSKITRLRKIKNYLVGAVKMTEQQNYSFADEDFLSESDIKVHPTPRLVNPTSQNNCRLIDSLIPGLFKNVKQNHVHRESLAFFEFSKIWNLQNNKINEKSSLAGLFFEKKDSVNFFDCKQHISELFRHLDVDADKIEWKKLDKPEREWYAAFQSADIVLEGKKIGTIGRADQFFLSKLKIYDTCSAFIFELDGDWLLTTETKQKRYSAFSKFQESYFDLSFMVPLTVRSIDIQKTISDVSDIIKKVEVIDFFEKDDWTDARSITFRAWIEHFDRTLEKDEIDSTMQAAINKVALLGVKLRS